MSHNMLTSFRGYVLASVLLATAVVTHAVYMKRFFYRSVIFLAKSKLAILAVGNMALVSVLLLYRLIQAIFLGPLRFRELERLHIRARDAIIESCFAMSVFREEFDLKFVALVMILLLLKSLHWLVKDRIEFLEEQPLSPVRTHLRLVGLMSLLMVGDILLIKEFASITIRTTGPTMFVLFAFEFTIVLVELFCDIVRYCFLVIDNSMEGHWEGKSMLSFYVELLSDLCQLTAYLLFSIYVQIYYTFPFHILREVYVTFNRFQRRCSDFWRYRKVVATMNDLFEDASEEELAAGDRTCIICREEMQTAKKLECGHMFHARCLQSWLKRQLTCPTCRAPIDVNGSHQNRARSGNQPQNNDAPIEQQGNQRQPNGNNGGADNGNAGQQQLNGNGNANIGEAGARLVNLANQWWNQIMIQHNAAPGVPGGQAAAPLPNAVGAGANANVQGAQAPAVPDINLQHPHRAFMARIPLQGGAALPEGGHQALPVHQNFQNPGNVFGGGRYPFPAAQAHYQNVGDNALAENAQRQNPHDNGLTGPAVLHGPNALAHMQLRARRRVALTQPHQQQFHYPEQRRGQQHPRPPNVFQPFPGMNQPPQVARNSRENIEPGNSTSGIVGSDDQARNITSGPASSVIEAQGQDQVENNRTVRATTSTQQRPTHPSGSERDSNPTTSGGAHHVDPAAVQLPLDRLIYIQERIEELRSEVMQLVILATATPQTGTGTENLANSMRGASSAQAIDDHTQDLDSGVETTGGTTNELEENTPEEDSEAAVLRRRRLEYLRRGGGS